MIPKIIHQVWIGPRPAPVKWLKTWPEKHPGWNYIFWDNKKVFRRKWINQEFVEKFKKQKFWRGVADVVRVEILFEFGGFMPGADYFCVNPVDELFLDDYENYTISTAANKRDFEDPGVGGLVTPLIACKKGSDFAGKLIKKISTDGRDLEIKRKSMADHFRESLFANTFMMSAIREYNPKIKVWPTYFFIQDYPPNWKYRGNKKIYSHHYFGGRDYAIKKYDEGAK